MWVDTRSVHSDNPGWRDMVSSCFHEWLGTFMIAVRRPCLAMHLQKTYHQNPLGGARPGQRARASSRREDYGLSLDRPEELGRHARAQPQLDPERGKR